MNKQNIVSALLFIASLFIIFSVFYTLGDIIYYLYKLVLC